MKSAIDFEEEGYVVDLAHARSKKFCAQYLVARKSSPGGYTLDYVLTAHETKMVSPDGRTVWLYEATGQDSYIFHDFVSEERDDEFDCVKQAFGDLEDGLQKKYGDDDVEAL